MRLDLFLAELLYDHDCVIVPGFGGLVANYRPAKLNERTHVISPPAKHIGFNRNLVRNDGLLVNHIAHTLNLDYANVLQQVESCVTEYKSQLATGKRVVWEKIGFVYRDTLANVQFIPDEQENFLAESYGLTSIQLKPVAVREKEIPEVKQVVERVVNNNSRRWLAAAAVVIPVMIAAGWMMGSQITGSKGSSLANFNPFRKEVKATYAPIPERNFSSPTEIVPTENNLEKILNEQNFSDTLHYSFAKDAVDENGIAIVESRPEQNHDAKPISNLKSQISNPYSVIAGAFMIKENADRLVNQLRDKGFSSMIIGRSRGLHLVSCGNYNTKVEARNAMRNLRENENMKAWVRKN